MKLYCHVCLNALFASLLFFTIPQATATSLAEALTGNDIERIEALLHSEEGKKQLSLVDERGLSPLDIALGETSFLFAPDIVRLLLETGAQPGRAGTDSALVLARLACLGGSADAWQAALAGARVDDRLPNGFSPFLWAVACNPDPAVLHLLVQAGADPLQTLPPSMDHPEMAGPNALLLAAGNNPSEAVVKSLLHYGIDLESRTFFGRTPLLEACWRNPNSEVALALLMAGAQVNAADGVSTTPFLAAVKNPGALPLLMALRGKGADIRAVDDSGSNALHLAAAQNSDTEVILYLLQVGGPLNQIADKNHLGETPLMLAVRHNPNPDVIRLLLEAGSDIRSLDAEGLSAWEGLSGDRIAWLEQEGLHQPPASSGKTPEQIAAEKRLLGRHSFSLQWISWKKFGVADIRRDASGRLTVEARQTLNGDEAVVKGRVTVMDDRTFVVDGEVMTRVSHINGGNACIRSGSFTFKATGKRKYWRMQEMTNPCEDVVDYVDIYF